jgi:hypothetical protein
MAILKNVEKYRLGQHVESRCSYNNLVLDTCAYDNFLFASRIQDSNGGGTIYVFRGYTFFFEAKSKKSLGLI